MLDEAWESVKKIPEMLDKARRLEYHTRLV
jgi:hypothetical protein